VSNSPKWTANNRTLFQFLITLIFSLLPLIFSSAVIYLTEDKTLKTIAHQILGNGELVIYSATLLAPVLYATYKNPPVQFKTFFNLIAWLIILINAVFYPLYHMGVIIKDLYAPSLILTAFVLILIYIIMFLEHFAETKTNAPKAAQMDNERFKRDFRHYRGEQ